MLGLLALQCLPGLGSFGGLFWDVGCMVLILGVEVCKG